MGGRHSGRTQCGKIGGFALTVSSLTIKARWRNLSRERSNAGAQHCLDLFAGLGGFSQAFEEAEGWEVTTVDIQERFGTDICADVMDSPRPTCQMRMWFWPRRHVRVFRWPRTATIPTSTALNP